MSLSLPVRLRWELPDRLPSNLSRCRTRPILGTAGRPAPAGPALPRPLSLPVCQSNHGFKPYVTAYLALFVLPPPLEGCLCRPRDTEG